MNLDYIKAMKELGSDPTTSGPMFLEQTLKRSRKTALTNEFKAKKKNIYVDTCCAFDTHKWETGIQVDDGNVVIVEDYGNEVEATKGHKKWMKEMKKNPNKKIKDLSGLF